MKKNNNKNEYIFSIIVTAYNVSKYIIETFDSITNQTFQNYEVIIIDDFSDDDSHKLIEDYIVGKENWSLYTNDKNRGIVYSRNRGFGLAKGKFIAIVDGDDVWENNKLEKQYEVLKDGSVDLCYSSYSYINENSDQFNYVYKTKEKGEYQSLLKENFIGCSTAVFKTEIISNVKMDNRVIHEDYFFWLNILKKGYTAKGILNPLVKYRVHSKARSYNKLRAAKNRYIILRKYEKFGILKSLFYFIHYAYHAIIKFLSIYLKINGN